MQSEHEQKSFCSKQTTQILQDKRYSISSKIKGELLCALAGLFLEMYFLLDGKQGLEDIFAYPHSEHCSSKLPKGGSDPNIRQLANT